MVPYRRSRGYWGIGVAIGLAAITFFAVGTGLHWLESTTPEISRDRSTEEEVAGYYPGGYACNPSEVGPFPSGINTSETESCKEAREEYRLKADDLLQQTRSADASEIMTGLSYKQTVLGIAGLGFGFLTFCAAVAAALYARNAANAAEDAVCIATHQANVAEEAHLLNLRQARAVLEIGDIQIGLNRGAGLHLGIVVRNTGNTEARNVHLVISSNYPIEIPEEALAAGAPRTQRAVGTSDPIPLGAILGKSEFNLENWVDQKIIVGQLFNWSEPLVLLIKIGVFGTDFNREEVSTFQTVIAHGKRSLDGRPVYFTLTLLADDPYEAGSYDGIRAKAWATPRYEELKPKQRA